MEEKEYQDETTRQLHKLLSNQYNQGMLMGMSVVADGVLRKLKDDSKSIADRIMEIKYYCSQEQIDKLHKVLSAVYENSIPTKKEDKSDN